MARPSWVIEVSSTLGVFWRRVGVQGRGHSRWWRMLRLPLVDALVQPLHAAGDVGGFVVGVTKDLVGGDNPDGGKQNQGYGDGEAMAFQKPFDCQGRGSRNCCDWGRSAALLLLHRHCSELSMALLRAGGGEVPRGVIQHQHPIVAAPAGRRCKLAALRLCKVLDVCRGA